MLIDPRMIQRTRYRGRTRLSREQFEKLPTVRYIQNTRVNRFAKMLMATEDGRPNRWHEVYHGYSCGYTYYSLAEIVVVVPC